MKLITMNETQGYNQGVFSGVLTMPSFMSRMGDYDSNDPADQSRKGWLTSILELGARIGALLSGSMAEALSTKHGISIATDMPILIYSNLQNSRIESIQPDSHEVISYLQRNMLKSLAQM